MTQETPASPLASAFELHGMLRGLECAGVEDPPAALCHELTHSDSVIQDAAALQQGQLLKILRALDGSQTGRHWSMHPLLPDDSASLQERAAALAQWVHGYLYGIGLGHVDMRPVQDSEEGRQALTDLVEISRMDCQVHQDSEEDEVALTEIEEFVWVAAELICATLGNQKPPHVD